MELEMLDTNPWNDQKEVLTEQFMQSLLRASKPDAERILHQIHQAESLFPQSVESIVVTSLERIGRDWETGKVALSQVYMSGRICEDLMTATYPENDVQARISGKCGIAILNDYHMLGKRIVLSALRSAGFNIQDWGRLTPEQVVSRIEENGTEVALLSTLMLSSALCVRDVRARLDAKGLKCKLLVGGAPFRLDKNLWKEVGADSTADNAMDSIRALSTLLGRQA
jgi:methanogenic corrinoid protein MtbC1